MSAAEFNYCAVAYGFFKNYVGKPCRKLLTEHINNRILRAEVISVYEIDTMLLSHQKVMIFYFGRKICVTALFDCIFKLITACAA